MTYKEYIDSKISIDESNQIDSDMLNEDLSSIIGALFLSIPGVKFLDKKVAEVNIKSQTKHLNNLRKEFDNSSSEKKREKIERYIKLAEDTISFLEEYVKLLDSNEKQKASAYYTRSIKKLKDDTEELKKDSFFSKLIKAVSPIKKHKYKYRY